MTTTLTVLPTYPIPGKTAKVTFTATVGNYVRLYVTAAPEGSRLQRQIDEQDSTRVPVFQGDATGSWLFDPDLAGAYVFSIDEITKGASLYGGAYEDDPDAQTTETVEGTDAATIYVGSRMTMRIGADPDIATLVLYVFNATIRETTLDLHGEVSPAIVDAATERARTAAEATATVTALANLVGVTGSTAVGTLGTTVDGLIDNLNAHLIQGSVHANNDTDNTVIEEFLNPVTPIAVVKSARELALRLSRHMLNDADGTGAGSAASAYHSPSGTDAADLTNTPLVDTASESDLQTLIALIADRWDAYEKHRVSSIHDTSDTTNTATALPVLIETHRVFFNELRKASPAAPSTTNPGVTPLAHLAGMEPTPV